MPVRAGDGEGGSSASFSGRLWRLLIWPDSILVGGEDGRSKRPFAGRDNVRRRTRLGNRERPWTRLGERSRSGEVLAAFQYCTHVGVNP